MLQLLKETANYLQSQGVGSLGLTLFYGKVPSSPIGLTAVVGESGLRDQMETGLRKPSVQVLIRDQEFEVAGQRAEQVFSALDNKWNILAGIKGRWMGEHLPGAYYLDGNQFPVFTLNFSLLTTRANSI